MRIVLFLCLAGLLRGEEQDPAALNTKAQQLAGEQRPLEAERIWLEAIRIAPDYFPALFNLGYLYFKQDKMSDAEPLLRRAAGAAGDNFNAYYLLGAAWS